MLRRPPRSEGRIFTLAIFFFLLSWIRLIEGSNAQQQHQQPIRHTSSQKQSRASRPDVDIDSGDGGPSRKDGFDEAGDGFPQRVAAATALNPSSTSDSIQNQPVPTTHKNQDSNNEIVIPHDSSALA